jgi:dihydroneopterin aldolase
MSDKIFFQGLTVPCIIGTLPRERKKKQPVVIDMEFPAPVQKAAKRDDLRDALNYQKIAERATTFVSKSRFHLIETLAERLA